MVIKDTRNEKAPFKLNSPLLFSFGKSSRLPWPTRAAISR